MLRSTLCFFLALLTTPAWADEFGSFIGRVVATWGNDGRTMTLVEPFAYVDPTGRRWDAPKGSEVDGASIPQIAWSFIGGPFEGKYRNSSVIHDVACVERKREWQDVHLAFYTGMLASGVDRMMAKIMYAAVYQFGPRWDRNVKVMAVPIAEARFQASSIASTTRKGEHAVVQVHPGPSRPQPCPNCAFPLPDLPPNTADISVTFVPQSSTLSHDDFDSLKQSIERRDLTLSEIEDFKPGRRHGDK